MKCLTREIEEAERKQKELEEAELEWLTQEKERLEEEKWAEQQHAAALRGLEKVVEWRRAVLLVMGDGVVVTDDSGTICAS